MAALSRTSPISCEFELLAELISRNTNEEGLSLSPDKSRTLVKRLDEIKHKVLMLEHELGIHRAHEQDSALGGVLGDLCLEVMQDGVLDTAKGDTVVRPDFRKGKRP